MVDTVDVIFAYQRKNEQLRGILEEVLKAEFARATPTLMPDLRRRIEDALRNEE